MDEFLNEMQPETENRSTTENNVGDTVPDPLEAPYVPSAADPTFPSLDELWDASVPDIRNPASDATPTVLAPASEPTPAQPPVMNPMHYGFFPQPQIPPQHPPYPHSQQGYPGYPPAYYPPPPQPNPYGSYQPQPASSYVPSQPEPPKKKMSVGAKVFLWILGILFAGVFIGFVAYGASLTFDQETNKTPPAERLPGQETSQLPETSEWEHGVLPPIGGESSKAEDVFEESSSPGLGGGTTDMEPANPNGPQMQIQGIPSAVEELTSKEVANTVLPSVVGIIVYDSGDSLSFSAISEGSGIILSADGYILTNSHVVSLSGRYRITVRLSDGSDHDARLVGNDSRTDLAVIKIQATGLTPANFGDSDQLSPGEEVVAIGNPGGVMYAGSVTKGIVSALNRPITRNGVPSMMKYIQTDAAINPGNSGGALVNMYGQVIGINTAKIVSAEYEGIGFAIPSVAAKSVIDDLIRLGYVSDRVKIGVTCKEVTADQVSSYGLTGGLLIMSISDDSGLKDTEAMVNDIIVEADGIQIKTLDQFFEILAAHKPGDTLDVKLFRLPANGLGDGETIEIQAELKADIGR